MPQRQQVAPTAIVLAGGQGTRIRHLLPDLPKPLAPVAGRPFLEWVLRYLRGQGVGSVVLSIGYQADKVELFANSIAHEGLAIRCVKETAPLGTAGAFVHALQAASRDASELLVCNGDSLALADLTPVLGALAAPAIDGALLAVRMDDASRYGMIDVRENALLHGFLEKHPGAGLVNGGVYLFRRASLIRFPQKAPLSFEYDVFPALVASGAQIKVVDCAAPFLDIGTEATLAQANDFIQDNMRWFT